MSSFKKEVDQLVEISNRESLGAVYLEEEEIFHNSRV